MLSMVWVMSEDDTMASSYGHESGAEPDSFVLNQYGEGNSNRVSLSESPLNETIRGMSSTPYCAPANRGLAILYLSEQLIVVNKPSGLLSVPGRGEGKEDCLSRRVQAEFSDALIVHRLDMGTSGIVVMGRGAKA